MPRKPTQPAATGIVPARVLMDVVIDGVAYHNGQVVEVDERTLARTDGALDPHPDAVAYALGQGTVPVRHPQP